MAHANRQLYLAGCVCVCVCAYLAVVSSEHIQGGGGGKVPVANSLIPGACFVRHTHTHIYIAPKPACIHGCAHLRVYLCVCVCVCVSLT